MANVYVGTASAGAADGTSWANRYGSLSAAEARPLSAGDVVYVGAGVYRETLTVGVSGTSGNPITYIADISGANTDGVGGLVRVTGSNNDTTGTRNQCITATSRNYRTFRGFAFDMGNGDPVVLFADCTNIIVEDCSFQTGANANTLLRFSGASQSTNTVRRCMFIGVRNATALDITHTSTIDNVGHTIENCIFIGPQNSRAVGTTRVGGITVRNCTFLACGLGVQIATALSGTATAVTVNNCIFHGLATGVSATVSGEIVENYNSFTNTATPRGNVATGANSNTSPPIFNPLVLLAGYVRPQLPPYSLSEWSALRAIAGTNEASDDLRGIARPATSAKKSWGAVQSNELGRETTTVRTGVASLRLSDAGRYQMFVPTTAVSTTISVYTRWEANYAGTKPQMVIKQPGQADITVTATGSAGAWELLTHTFTPAASPGYVVVELVSSNTATSGSYSTYFDDLEVS